MATENVSATPWAASTSKNDFAGMSVGQVQILLETVATLSNTASQICTHHAHSQDSTELGNVFRALESMLNVIGSLADKPINGNCVGSDTDWHCGPMFRSA